MSVDVKSDRLGELVDENAEVEQLGTGFTFTEGPIWNPDGPVSCSSRTCRATRAGAWDEQNGIEVVASPSNKGNGMTLDADGRLIVCEHSTSSLVRMDPGREGHEPRGARLPLRGPGAEQPERRVRQVGRVDLVLRPVVRAHAGASASSASASSAGRASSASPPGGGDPQLVVDKDEYEQPNGLCFSPDESLLYINDTPKALDQGLRRRLRTASLSNGRLFFEGVGTGVIEEGIPDGMKCDEQGNIWVTGPGGVWVISADGEHLGTIQIPENTGNLTWGGADWHTLFIPSSTSLYAVKTKVGPRREPYMS